MNILILGGFGYIGSNLAKSLSKNNTVITPTRDDLNLSLVIDKSKFLRCVNDVTGYKLSEFDFVINCVALINQDKVVTDVEYRKKMYDTNVYYDFLLGQAFSGNYVHISSGMAFYPECNWYCLTKNLALRQNQLRPRTTSVVLSQPYGGEKNNNFQSFLRKNENTSLVLDNRGSLNAIHIDNLCTAVKYVLSMNSDSEKSNTVFVYEDKVFNKYTLACYLAGEMNISTKNWKAGIFTKDAGNRPINWRIDNIPNGNGYSSYVFPLKFGEVK